jgi:hypothetical protein
VGTSRAGSMLKRKFWAGFVPRPSQWKRTVRLRLIPADVSSQLHLNPLPPPSQGDLDLGRDDCVAETTLRGWPYRTRTLMCSPTMECIGASGALYSLSCPVVVPRVLLAPKRRFPNHGSQRQISFQEDSDTDCRAPICDASRRATLSDGELPLARLAWPNHAVGPASTKDFIGVDHANIGVRRRRSPYRRDFCADLSAFNREG